MPYYIVILNEADFVTIDAAEGGVKDLEHHTGSRLRIPAPDSSLTDDNATLRMTMKGVQNDREAEFRLARTTFRR